MPTVRDLIAALDARYPLSRAESWDRVGLQIGDVNAKVERVLVAHEATDAVLDEADGCDALVVYHPLLFRPLENLNFADHSARLAARCISAGIHLIAAHTALDNAAPPTALGDRLAASLRLQDIAVLKPSGHEALCKIVVFVPDEALQKVSEALWEAGAGNIGKYDRASFRGQGSGTFRPQEGADPYEGEIGKDETVNEWRLEVIAPVTKRDRIVQSMIAVHPYEEVAYDVYPLQNKVAPYGSARRGKIAKTSLAEFARKVGADLGAPNVRIVEGGRAIETVACVPGSGASYIDAAASAGIDCLVTGDIKHHDALKAAARGLALVDVTHAATEGATIEMLADSLGYWNIEVRRSRLETNPFRGV